jgi:hypothetical protein
VGNLHLRFDEGRVGRATGVALSPTLPKYPARENPDKACPLGLLPIKALTSVDPHSTWTR